MITPRSLALIFVAAALSVAHAGSPAPDPSLDLVKNSDQGIVYAVPKAGPLRLKKVDRDGAHFTGSIRIAGSYIYGYNADASDDAEYERTAEPDLYFIPDDAARALLPYWCERGPVRGLYFSNRDAFVRAAIASPLAAQVKSRKIKSVTGLLTIWIDAYVATGECDTPIYTARFLKIERAPDVVAHNAYADPISCG